MNLLDSRIASAHWTREPVEQGTDEFLYLTQAINDPVILNEGTQDEEEVDRRVVAWYKIRLNGWPISGLDPTLDASGRVMKGPAGTPPNQAAVHLFYPSGVVNTDFDFYVVMAQTGALEASSIQGWWRKLDGTDAGLPFLLKSSPSANTPDINGCYRYGDYFDIALDADDMTRFWATGELVENPSDPSWTTWIFEREDVAP